MTIHFIGAGPGDPDLITLKGYKIISKCPVCLYAGSLIPQEILSHCPQNAKLIDTSHMNLDSILAEFKLASKNNLDVARLHSGDLSIWSAMGEQIRRLKEERINFSITPGVPSFSAASAVLENEFTLPEVTQTVILTRTAGRATKMPSDDQTNILILRSFGKFFGLAGIRLGFLISNKEIDKKIQFLIGTWPISNVAINVASKALIDDVWIMNTISFLKEGSYFLDCLASEISWKVVGGTNLYRLYETPNADDAQNKLANFKIWSRCFTYSKKWIRLGIPRKKDFKKVSEIFKKLY